MRKREIEILKTMLAQEDLLSYEFLTNAFNTSLRSIQNDLLEIDIELKMHKLPLIIRRYKQGVGIVRTQDNLKQMQQFIASHVKNDYYSFQQRDIVILMQLMNHSNYVTLSRLAEVLNVSKSTIINDVKRLRNALGKEAISIQSDTHYGIRLLADELALRNFLLHSYRKYLDSMNVTSMKDYLTYSISDVCFGKEDKTYCKEIANYSALLQGEIGNRYTFDAELNLLLSLELCVWRCTSKSYIQLVTKQMRIIMDSREYEIMYKSTRQIEQVYNIHIPNDEVNYLTMQVLSSNTIHYNHLENYMEIQILVCDLIRSVGNELQRDLRSNLTLYHALICHIRPTIYRMMNHNVQENPLLEDIKAMYGDIFLMVKHNITMIEQFTRSQMSEDEIGFIALHFACTLETNKFTEYRKIRVLIVCCFGLGTSRLLESNIKSLYDVHVVGIVGNEDIRHVVDDLNPDFIISTEDVKHPQRPVLFVSALLKKKDIDYLDKFLIRKGKKEMDLETLISIIKRNCIVSNEDELLRELHETYQEETYKCEERIEESMLKDIIFKDMIELDYEAESWESAIREAGHLLKQGDCIEEPYIDAMIEVVKTLGDYIVIGNGIALPHSRSSKSVKKIGISFLRLVKPVYFNDSKSEPVDMIFALSAVDHQSHIQALSDLATILSEEENTRTLRSLVTSQAVIDFIHEVSKSL